MSLIFTIFLGFYIGVVQTNRMTTSCPKYVQEFQNLQCQCMSETLTGPSTNFQWYPHSVNAILNVEGVTRDMEGNKYTCYMITNGVIVNSIDYTLSIAYGPTSADVDGPQEFITDGTKDLTLTCTFNNAVPGVFYQWTFISTVSTQQCRSRPSPNTCVFRPQPGDNAGEIRCVTSNNVTYPNIISAYRNFRVSLKFPPQSAPVIDIGRGQEPLKEGDVLTCSVLGGIPLVASVNFYCNQPSHKDQPDVISHNGVTSQIDIHTSQADKNKLTCICEAVWEPVSAYYPHTTYRQFSMQYKTTIISFTVNNLDSLQLQEGSSPAAVVLSCNADGVPLPFIQITNDKGKVKRSSSGQPSLTFNLESVSCEDTGQYTCMADNYPAFPKPHPKTVYLNVTCAPKARPNDTTVGKDHVPEVDPNAGLVFILIANPMPTKFEYVGDSVRRDAQCQVFQIQCNTTDVVYKTTCSITGRKIPASCLGTYKASISNSIGTFTFNFYVKKSDLPTGAAARVSSVLMLVFSIIAAVVVY